MTGGHFQSFGQMTGNFRHLAKWLAVRGIWPNDWKFQLFGQITGLTHWL